MCNPYTNRSFCGSRRSWRQTKVLPPPAQMKHQKIDDGAGSGGCGFEVRRVGRRINMAAMFRYGGRGGERVGLGNFRWPVVEVRLRGLDFFSEGFRRYICSEGKNDEKNPPSSDLQMAIRG